VTDRLLTTFHKGIEQGGYKVCTWFLTGLCRKSRNCFLFPASRIIGDNRFRQNCFIRNDTIGDRFMKVQKKTDRVANCMFLIPLKRKVLC